MSTSHTYLVRIAALILHEYFIMQLVLNVSDLQHVGGGFSWPAVNAQTNFRFNNALTGAGSGAYLGSTLGGATGHPFVGAFGGAVVGGTLGFYFGNYNPGPMSRRR
ncbi:glycine zipper domain-containing protein [Undibacterium jejuense]|nr:glycine zipper domain-containing protein [Undibacterium jejuense]